MKKLLVALALLWCSPALAQTCPTRPPGDNSNACASTAFVGTANTNILNNVPTQPPGTNNNTAASTAFVQGIPSAQTFNVTRSPFNADPTGATANFGTAFNAAMTACVAGGNLGVARNGTVVIPAGFYKQGTTVMTWLAGCNILADDAAYIQANASIANMLVSTTGASNSLQDVSLRGGQWDCNASVTQDGFKLPDFARLVLMNFRMYNCNGAAGNGSVGGFIRLGGSGATQFNALTIDHLYAYNFTSPVTTLVAGNQGIFSDPSGTGVTDSFITNTVIAGTSIAYQGNCFDCIFYNNHAFVFSSQGNMVNGFKMTSGQIRLTNNQVDGPLVSANAAYDLSGGAGKPYTLVSNGYFEGTRDNVSNAVNIGAGTTIKSYGNHWIGNSGANRILTDYTGTLTNLSVIEDYQLNVSTIVGGAWLAFTATPTCGNASITTNSARFRNIAKLTYVEIDFTISATIGTCTNTLSWTMPNTSASPGAISGAEVANAGKGFACPFVGASSSANPCRKSDATAWLASDRLIASGVYENQ